MTEIEFLHEMVKAAGGNPDMLKDKLKSTYYECLINCLNNGGGGSGGGSTGGGNDKVIVGVFNGTKWEFSKTPAEIVALGESVLEYDFSIIVNGIKCYINGIKETTETSVTIEFISIANEKVSRYNLTFHAQNNSVGGGGLISPFPDLPQLPENENRLLVSVNGKIEHMPLNYGGHIPLVAADMNGTLFPAMTRTLAEIYADVFKKGNATVNLVVMQDMISETAANTYLVYHLARMENMSDTSNMRAIFSNGIDKDIEMNAAGNFFYID